MRVGPNKVFELDHYPKNSPAGPEKDKKGLKWGRLKKQKIGLYFQNQRRLSMWVGLENLLNMIQTLKIAQ